jgi:hypothetical protein
LLAILGLGGGGGYAASSLAAAASDPASVCDTSPAQTLTNGVVVSVVACVPGATTGTTSTTAPTTTATPPPSSYDQAISYSQTRPAFTPTRTVNVTTAAALKTALSNLQAGDLVQATSPFTVSSASSTPLVITNRPSATAEIDLTGVTIAYTGSSDTEAVELNNAANLNIFGGSITTGTAGGMCLRIFGTQHVLWYGFKLDTCGDTGLQVIASGTNPTDHDDLQGEISNVGLHTAYDPHSEKGTGLHAANLWDGPSSAGFTNNRFAFYAHDIPVGACVEYGNDTGVATSDVLYLKCINETEVSHVMTGGNGIQFWGSKTPTATLDIKYIECQNLQGACVYSIVNASGVTVEYGRASNTNQNPQVTGGVWNTTRGIVYQDVLPAP